MADDEYPKGAGRLEPRATVQIILPESMARQFEEKLLKPTGWKLAGPLLFSEDDLPSYILEMPK